MKIELVSTAYFEELISPLNSMYKMPFEKVTKLSHTTSNCLSCYKTHRARLQMHHCISPMIIKEKKLLKITATFCQLYKQIFITETDSCIPWKIPSKMTTVISMLECQNQQDCRPIMKQLHPFVCTSTMKQDKSSIRIVCLPPDFTSILMGCKATTILIIHKIGVFDYLSQQSSTSFQCLIRFDSWTNAFVSKHNGRVQLSVLVSKDKMKRLKLFFLMLEA